VGRQVQGQKYIKEKSEPNSVFNRENVLNKRKHFIESNG
jgi:hypothetical protein